MKQETGLSSKPFLSSTRQRSGSAPWHRWWAQAGVSQPAVCRAGMEFGRFGSLRGLHYAGDGQPKAWAGSKSSP